MHQKTAALDLLGSYARVVCIALCIGYLIVGLWPFNFHSHNRARWSSDAKGLHFEPLAIATSVGSIDLGTAVPGAGGGEALQFGIELLISSEMEGTRNTRSFISLYDGAFPENLLLAQWKTAFLVRTAVIDARGRRKYREMGVDKALPAGKQRFLAITSGAGGTSLYIEGRLVKASPRVVLRSGSLRGKLIVGSSAKNYAAFTGSLLGLALFDRMLDAKDIERHCLLWKTGCAAEMAAERDLAGLYLMEVGGTRWRTFRDSDGHW